MNRGGIIEFIFFFTYLIVQVVFFRNLVLFNVAFCFPYIAFILLMNMRTSTVILMSLGFMMGFIIDIFYDSLGLHASALVFLAFIRNLWLDRITLQGKDKIGVRPILSTNGIGWFLLYAFPLIFLHHVVIFFVEIGGGGLIKYTFLKIFTSSLFTLSVILVLQYLLPRQKKV